MSSSEAEARDDLPQPPQACPVTNVQFALVALMAIAATAPFLNKAFHIDDVLYLRGAEQTLRTPWDPYQGMVLWDAADGQPAPLFEIDYNPPAWKYVLGAALATFASDRDERKLHLVQSVAVAAAAFGAFQLGRRFTRHPLWCAGLIVMGPFFLPGQNLMLEAPMLALCCWGMEFLFRGLRADRRSWIWLAGAVFATAMMTKYTAGLMAPLTMLAAFVWKRPKALWALAIPTLTLAGWTIHSLAFHGQPHLGGQRFHLEWTDIPLRSFAVLRIVGAVTVFGPLIVACLWARERSGKAIAVAILLAAAVYSWLDLTRLTAELEVRLQWELSTLRQAHYLAFGLHGATIVLGGIALAVVRRRAGDRRPEDRFLEYWIVGMLVFNVACVPFNAVRHLLLGFVPAVWWMSRRLEEAGDRPRLRRSALVVSTVLAFLLAWGDCEFAGTYRTVAREQVLLHTSAGRTVWFTGTWGFAYYASQAGANPLVDSPEQYGLPPLNAGQLIFNPALLNWHPFPPDGIKATPTEHIQPEAGSFLRTMGPGVNYYSTLDYAIPWALMIHPPHPDEPDAFYEMPPIDDVLLYRIVAVEQ